MGAIAGTGCCYSQCIKWGGDPQSAADLPAVLEKKAANGSRHLVFGPQIRIIEHMRITPRVTLYLALAVTVMVPPAMLAQFRHPRYLHARSDLRRATILMRLPDDPNVMRDMQE